MDDIRLALGASGYAEELYRRYATDPYSVDDSWREYFDNLEGNVAASVAGPSWTRSNWPIADQDDLTAALDAGTLASLPPKAPKGAKPGVAPDAGTIRAATLDSLRALMMVRAYRVRGHLYANLDPLGLDERPAHPELEPSTYGFGAADMDRPIFMDKVLGLDTATMREIVEILRRTYCDKIGVEFMHIFDPDEKSWIQSHIEGRDKEIHFTPEGKKAILNKVIEAEQFEKFLGRKYTGTKRFGLDGGEAMIPALEAIIKTGSQNGCDELVLGMPHRGRLNVLANVMRKPYRAIFHEFHGGSNTPEDVGGSGDVKYHLGTSSDREFDGKTVHLSLTPNPSHLEAVDPVVLGKVRAKLTQRGDVNGVSVGSVLLHGDAAFSGQGLVAECLMMSGLNGYKTGGTIHFIVNNQIGFTTSPQYSRSSPYPSDMAKMVQAPVFHVNGDDPEAVVYVTKLATEFRQRFKKDVVVDMFCYRRFGHNESDEPAFTQPLMYAKIRQHPSTATIYAERLVREGLMTQAEVDEMTSAHVNKFEDEFTAAKEHQATKADWLEGKWTGLDAARDHARKVDTGVAFTSLKEVGVALTTIPDGHNVHPTLKRVVEGRAKAIDDGAGIDWATAEQLAFGTLIREGFPVRLSGQDCKRGTFSQRHSVWVDQKTEKTYTPLMHVPGATFEVLDSPLSEAGVLGFEYGYSLSEPRALVLWEAQFGDFANGAQVIIDQFISSGEHKWLRMSGLVMLLPHGYEGQGPEHSSARLERYLQNSAEDNWQIANVTTPSQYFHILRRQLHRKFRKPLIMMTPKSLLRHKKCVSKLDEMGPATEFHRILDDDADRKTGHSSITLKPDNKIRKVIACSGKVYYDILEARDEAKADDTYILRFEQLYPFATDAAVDYFKRFPNMETLVWCQEEPKNMGAWSYIEPWLEEALAGAGSKAKRPIYAGRGSSASTATGLASKHARQQEELLAAALSA